MGLDLVEGSPVQGGPKVLRRLGATASRPCCAVPLIRARTGQKTARESADEPMNVTCASDLKVRYQVEQAQVSS